MLTSTTPFAHGRSVVRLCALVLVASCAFGQVPQRDDYTLLMRHQNATNGFFAPEVRATGIENADNPNANTYCIIGAVDPAAFLQDGDLYELELTYSYADGTVDVLTWTQDSWITEATAGNVDVASAISDANAADVATAFRGLAKSSNAATYLDGSPSHANWFHAVASVNQYLGGIPGHETKVAYHSELWVRKSDGGDALVCADEPVTLTCGDGDVIQVVSARYGNFDDSYGECGVPQSASACDFDAMEYISGLCNGDQLCTVNADNFYLVPYLGDPCPGVHKYMDISYECVDDTQDALVCADEPVTLTCGVGDVIQVVSARYGNFDDSYGECGVPQSASACDFDAMEYISGLCNGDQLCTVNADNFYLFPYLGDPCPGVHKYMDISYDCEELTNVAIVEFDGGLGSFRQTSAHQWVETSAQRDNTVAYWYDEIGRTATSITLHDPVRGFYTLLDLVANAVRFKSTLEAPFVDLYTISYAAVLDEPYAVYKSLARQYAPIVWLANGEEWFPSSVTYFQSKVNLAGNRYVTKDPLSSPSDWDWDGALGHNPTEQVVPTYSFINTDPSGRFFDVSYFGFYPYNRGKEKLDTFWGNHVGDWENVRISFSRGTDGVYVPLEVTYESHGDANTVSWDDAEKEDGRVLAYSAYGAHGTYPAQGSWEYDSIPVLGSLVDHTSQGTPWHTRQSLVTIFQHTVPITPITNVYVSESSQCPSGTTRATQSSDLNGDLNEGSGGKDIYLCVSREQSHTPITGLYLATSSQCPAEYTIAPKQSSLNGDLNQGAGGSDIYLCIEKSSRYSDAIHELSLTSSSATPAGFVAPILAAGLNGDLNQGAGGKDIYLYGKRSADVEWACTGNDGAPFAEDCSTWLNFPADFRWGNAEEGCTVAGVSVGVCRLENGPTGPATKKAVTVPGFAPPSGPGFVSEILFAEGPQCPTGYVLTQKDSSLNGDLNEGAGGKDIYMCITRDVAPENAVREIHLQESSQCPAGTERAQQDSGLNGDLNQGAGGKDIYTCVVKVASTPSLPIVDTFLATNYNTCPTAYEAPTVVGSLNGDLNQGAGGKDIYMCLLRAEA